MDALTAPFVQGKLREEELSIQIQSNCAHCGQLISLEIDSNLSAADLPETSKMLITLPILNLQQLKDPSIIDAL